MPTFVSNDKVNERIFQREPALPEFLFYFKDWTNWSSLEKDRRRAEWLSAMQIITYLHSVSLLRIRQITIWKWAQKHCGQKACIMIPSYIIADMQPLRDTHADKHTVICCLWTCCRGIIWRPWCDWGLVLLLYGDEIGFQPVRCYFGFIYQVPDVVIFGRRPWIIRPKLWIE